MKRRRLAIALTAAGLVALPLKSGPLVLAALWVLATLCIPLGTWARSAMAAPLLLFAGNSCVLTALSVLRVACNPSTLAGGSLVVLGVAASIQSRRHRPMVADADDLLALALGALTIVMLLPPLIGASPGTALTLISQTTDGGNHAQLVLGTQEARGYLAFHPVAGMREGMDQYPGAWPANVWLLGELGLMHRIAPLDVVRLLAALGVVTYALLMCLTCRLALSLHRSLRDATIESRLTVVGLTGVSSLAGFGLYMLNLASFPQMLASIAIILAIWCLFDATSPLMALVATCLSTVVVAQSWYLLLPVLLGPHLVLLVHRRPKSNHIALGALATTPFVVFPLLTGPGSKHLAATGPSVLPPLWGILGLLLATAVAVATLLVQRAAEDVIRLATCATVVGALLLLAALVFVQPHEQAGAYYYTAKALLTLLWLGTVGAAALGGLATRGRPGALISVVCILGAAWTTRHLALPPREAHTAGHLVPRELDAVLERHPHLLAPGTDIWLADGCDRVGDLVGSKLFYDLSLTWDERRAAALGAYTDRGAPLHEVLSQRSEDPAVGAVEVYVVRPCQQRQLTTLMNLPKVTVIRVP